MARIVAEEKAMVARAGGRRGWWAGAILAGAIVAGGMPALTLAQPAPGFADLAARVGPAVVNIQTRKTAEQGQGGPALPQVPPGSPFEEFFREFFDRERQQQQQQQQQRRMFSQGSGFVIDPTGFVVTNNHVIADSDEITVVFNDEKEFKARVIGRDPKTDLALLKIEGSEGPFTAVEWADSNQVRVGDWMLAIGNPFGLGSTVTAGIVSARGRDIRSGPYDDFLQVDAAINRGNSGGPSFTLDGKVFGVNTAIFSPSGGNVGIGFAIPSNLARPVIESLKASGRVARGWLGVRIQAVTPEIAESLSLPGPDGALVAGVTPGGPAASAEIEAGDVILRFDGKTVDRMRSLPRLVAETSIGRDVDVLVWRRGEQRTVKVKVGALPDDEQLAALDRGEQRGPEAAGGKAPIAELGLTVASLTTELRAQFSIGENVKGVVVTDIEAAGPAAGEGLRPGDVIVEVGQEQVGSPPELNAKVRQAKQENKKAALLLVDRQGDLRFVALRLR
jgi:serine protease Do